MAPRLLAIGVAAGAFSGLFGVGGGILTVPLLVLAARFPQREAMATSLGAIGITALAGTLVFASHGQLRPAEAALVGLPAALGAVAGSRLQQRLSTRTLAYAFAGLLVVIAVTLLLP